MLSVVDQAEIQWRGGVHIAGTEIWCDARRAQEVCFVSCAHAVEASRHGQLIASQTTLDLLSRADKKFQPHAQLSVPYGRPFTLGTRRVELVRSGHSIGSASLLFESDGRRILYAGTVNPAGGGLGDTADIRACDTLIISARYGDEQFAFPSVDDVAPQVEGFVREVHTDGGMAVLLVSSASKGLDVADRLSRAKIHVIAHRSIHHAAQRIRPRVALPKIRRWSGKPPATRGPVRVLLWPVHLRPALTKVDMPNSRVALLSGAAIEVGANKRHEVDTSFAWSNAADYQRLTEYVDASGASQVYFTDRWARTLAANMDTSKRRATALGPAIQLSLFG